jgi:NADH-quinone oxidoreductase subunit J
MNFLDIVFYVFAGITVFAAMGVITARNPVNAALFLVLAFCSAAGSWKPSSWPSCWCWYMSVR